MESLITLETVKTAMENLITLDIIEQLWNVGHVGYDGKFDHIGNDEKVM